LAVEPVHQAICPNSGRFAKISQPLQPKRSNRQLVLHTENRLKTTEKPKQAKWLTNDKPVPDLRRYMLD